MRDVARNVTVCLVVAALAVPPSAMAGRLPPGGGWSEQATARAALKVVIIDGDEAANAVQEKMAAEPIVEVQDSEGRKIAGAVVRFKVRRGITNRLSAAFRGGKDEVRTLTDAAGRARTGPLTPLEAGRFEIEVHATHQGQTSTATIRHTNFSSAAQARAAGREPAQASGSTAGAQAGTAAAGAGATAGAGVAAGAGAAGGGAAAAAAGGGIGFGKLALIGLTVGGAGAGAVVYANSRKNSGPAAALSAITLSQTSGVQSATPFRFSVQASNFSGSTTYRWDFGDGESSTEEAPTHVFHTAGRYAIALTVTDGKDTVRADSAVTIYSLTGTWVNAASGTAYTLGQSGTTLSGATTGTFPAQNGDPSWTFDCPLTGTVRSTAPTVVFSRGQCRTVPSGFGLVAAEFRFELDATGQRLTGESTQSQSVFSVTLQKQ